MKARRLYRHLGLKSIIPERYVWLVYLALVLGIGIGFVAFLILKKL